MTTSIGYIAIGEVHMYCMINVVFISPARSKYDPGYERVKVKMLGRSLPAPNDESDGGQR